MGFRVVHIWIWLYDRAHVNTQKRDVSLLHSIARNSLPHGSPSTDPHANRKLMSVEQMRIYSIKRLNCVYNQAALERREASSD